MTAILYTKRLFCDIFDETSRGQNFHDIQDAISHACDSKLTNTRGVYKVTMVETGESKIFAKNTRR